MAASLVISGCWHLLLLSILTLTVHPFQIPDNDRPINLDILPAFPVELIPRPKPPPPQPSRIRLRQAEPVLRSEPLRTQPQLRRLNEEQAQPDIQPVPESELPKDVAHPVEPIARKPLDMDLGAAVRPQPLQSDRNLPAITPLPDAPLPAARPSPSVLPRPVEAPNLRAPSRTAPNLRSDRSQPDITPSEVIVTAPPRFEAQPAAPSTSASETPVPPGSVRVLTTDQIVRGPVELRPPDRPAQVRPSVTGPPALPDLAGGDEPPAGGGLSGGGAQGSAGGRPFGYDANGILTGPRMSMRLGCLSPDTYRLTAEERAACLNRVGAEGRGARELNLNIPEAKQADYDRYEACHNATRERGVPGSTAGSGGSSVAGLGANPSLRACGPADR